MLRLVHSCQLFQTRIFPQRIARTTSIWKNLHSTSSCSTSSRGFSSTAWSKEEVELDSLPESGTPWLMLNPEIDKRTGDKLERFYSPAENRWVKLNRSKCLNMSNLAHCVGSTVGGWLSYVDPKDCSVFFTNPYTNDVFQLPSLTTLPSVLDVQRDPLSGAVIGLHMECGYTRGKTEDTHWYDPTWLANHRVGNVALTGSDPRDYDTVAVAIQGEERRLVYCPIGKAYQSSVDEDNDTSITTCPQEWQGLQEHYHPGETYHQAVYCENTSLFFTIFEGTGIQAYDLDNDRTRRSKVVLDFQMKYIYDGLEKAAEKRENATLKALDDNSHIRHYYLVSKHDDGSLLLLVKHYRMNDDFEGNSTTSTMHFDVFKVNFDSKELERLDSLGGVSIFVGLNQSFYVSADEVPGLRGNCIYFSEDVNRDAYTDWGYDHGIFDVENNRVLPLGYELLEKAPFSRKYSQFWVAPV